MKTVDFYFDFVSPYSYLAMSQAPAFGARHGATWRLKPVVYGALLDRTGLVGPVEVDSKRRYTFHDVVRTAQLLGVPMVGPPAHPFRSLEALRTVCVFADSPRLLELAVALSAACWAEGRDLTSPSVIIDVVEAVGLATDDLVERLGADEVKLLLRRNTEEALDAGVFGVPTFRLGNELFWGHDRMHHLAARLTGILATEPDARAMEERPRGTDRKRAPSASG